MHEVAGFRRSRGCGSRVSGLVFRVGESQSLGVLGFGDSGM